MKLNQFNPNIPLSISALLFAAILQHPHLMQSLYFRNVNTHLQIQKFHNNTDPLLAWDIFKLFASDIRSGNLFLRQ